MRAREGSMTKAKQKLVAATEKLCAERGFESVSVRDITQAAKANVAAVNYHFGNREQLLGAVMAGILGPIQNESLKQLDELVERGSIREGEVLWVLVKTIALSAKSSSLKERDYGILCGRTYGMEGCGMPRELEEGQKQIREKVVEILVGGGSGLERKELNDRLIFFQAGLTQVLERLAVDGGKLQERLERYFDFAYAGFVRGTDTQDRVGAQGITEEAEQGRAPATVDASNERSHVALEAVEQEVLEGGEKGEIGAEDPAGEVEIKSKKAGKKVEKKAEKKAAKPEKQQPQIFFDF